VCTDTHVAAQQVARRRSSVEAELAAVLRFIVGVTTPTMKRSTACMLRITANMPTCTAATSVRTCTPDVLMSSRTSRSCEKYMMNAKRKHCAKKP
jgi:hypothetical protein